MGHLRLTIGYLKATVVHIRVTLGYLKVTIGNFFSELHPKVRPTCLSTVDSTGVCGVCGDVRWQSAQGITAVREQRSAEFSAHSFTSLRAQRIQRPGLLLLFNPKSMVLLY